MYSFNHQRPIGTTLLKRASVGLPGWKRALDLLFCLAVMPFLALGTFVLALAMSIFAPGPVFFRQERVGHLGRRFMIYKFRTMKTGADTLKHQAYFKELVGTNAPMRKLDEQGDSRLIPGAWLLRASGLDELPQIINVLRGEMSLVGPRPCLPAEYELYLPWQRERFVATPGLTGLWQVSGKNRTTFEEMVRLDILYGGTKSMAMDLRILLATLPAMAGQVYDTRFRRQPKVTSAVTPSPAATRSGPEARISIENCPASLDARA
jgi:lipopolysaccharide/colanic/teichoic acid biosynthesis glycosyltransferase